MSSDSVSAAFSRAFAGVRRRGQGQDGISWGTGSHQGHEPTAVPWPRLLSHSMDAVTQHSSFPSGKADPSPWRGAQGCTVPVGREGRQFCIPAPHTSLPAGPGPLVCNPLPERSLL